MSGADSDQTTGRVTIENVNHPGSTSKVDAGMYHAMRDAMLNHGLDEAKISQEDGFFVVTLPGPAGNYDRIRTPSTVAGPVTPAIEAQLNDRQKIILAQVVAEGFVTNRWCRARFHVVYNTAYRDLQWLVALNVIQPVGSGRNVKYVPKAGHD